MGNMLSINLLGSSLGQLTAFPTNTALPIVAPTGDSFATTGIWSVMKEKLSLVKERATRGIFSNLETINRLSVMTGPLSAIIAGASLYLGSKIGSSVSNIGMLIGASKEDSSPRMQVVTQLTSVSYLIATFEQYQKSVSLRDAGKALGNLSRTTVLNRLKLGEKLGLFSYSEEKKRKKTQRANMAPGYARDLEPKRKKALKEYKELRKRAEHELTVKELLLSPEGSHLYRRILYLWGSFDAFRKSNGMAASSPNKPTEIWRQKKFLDALRNCINDGKCYSLSEITSKYEFKQYANIKMIRKMIRVLIGNNEVERRRQWRGSARSIRYRLKPVNPEDI